MGIKILFCVNFNQLVSYELERESPAVIVGLLLLQKVTDSHILAQLICVLIFPINVKVSEIGIFINFPTYYQNVIFATKG